MPEKKGRQGTGKHPHKSTEEPLPHTKEDKNEQETAGGGAGTARKKEQSAGGGAKEENRSGSSDLKEREYRDSQGNVHHHTHTYEEQHKNEK